MASVLTADLTVRFAQRSGLFRRGGTTDALIEFDLAGEPGQVLGILGPNGSGKTTLLRVLAGDDIRYSGRAEVLDLPPHDRRLARAVGYQPQGALPFGTISARELLRYVASILGLTRADGRRRADSLLELLGLAAAADRAHGAFSTGMARRLAVATALVGDPEVVLLDEPTSGLDPDGSQIVRELIVDLRRRNRTVLLASHHLHEVEEVCDRVHILVHGHCRRAGTLDELLRTDALELVARGVPAEAFAELAETVTARGGEVLRCGARRGRLEALVRELAATDRTLGEARPMPSEPPADAPADSPADAERTSPASTASACAGPAPGNQPPPKTARSNPDRAEIEPGHPESAERE